MSHFEIKHLARRKIKETGSRELFWFVQKVVLGGKIVVLESVLNCSELEKFSLVLQLGPYWQKDLHGGSKNPIFLSFQKLAGS